jgi:hypothetical protein
MTGIGLTIDDGAAQLRSVTTMLPMLEAGSRRQRQLQTGALRARYLPWSRSKLERCELARQYGAADIVGEPALY